MNGPLLELDSITKVYAGRQVLSSASLSVRKGEIVGLFGRNGAGKTTLLEIAVGRRRVDHGLVRYRGETRLRPRHHRLAREGLFYLPDGGLAVGRWTVRRHLRAVVGLGVSIAPGGEDPLQGVLADLELTVPLEAKAHELSTGERRRLEVALGVLREPDLLLADEPLRGISPRDRHMVGRGLTELRDRGAGVLVTGHEARDLLGMVDRVLWLADGRVRKLGDPEEARLDDGFRARYLGPGR